MPETQKLPDILTIAEIAARFNVKPETVRLWIINGKLTAQKIGPAPNAPYVATTTAVEAFAIKRNAKKKKTKTG
jgi:excisionase family DNA binding protein